MTSLSDVLYGTGIATATTGAVLLVFAPLYWFVWLFVALVGIILVLPSPDN